MPGGYTRDKQGVEPNYSTVRNQHHIAKRCEMVPLGERIPQMMQNAFAMLRNGRPGPVVLEIPDDIFVEEADPTLLDGYKPQRRSRPVAAPQERSEMLDLILGAKCPVVVAGQGILQGDACAELQELAELLQLPVMSTLNGKSCFPENHPLALGCGGKSRPGQVNHFLGKADVIIGLGTSFTRSFYITPIPLKGRTFIQLTNWEGDISKDYPIDMGIIGDAKASLRVMIDDIKSRYGDSGPGGRDDVAEEIAIHKKAFMDKWMPLLTSDEKPMTPYRIIWELMHAVDRDKTIVTHDAGTPRDQITAMWECTAPYSYLGWGKTTQLGTGLGLAHGAKLAKPDWNVINFMGDAAIGMVGMDFETGVRCKIGTLTIVFKNDIMGEYTTEHPNACELYEIEKLGGNYVDLARSFGGYAERVTEPGDLKAAIQRCLAKNADGIPALLECITREETRMARDLPPGL
jgi:acetolactate synthase-1/2/3 large subunit